MPPLPAARRYLDLFYNPSRKIREHQAFYPPTPFLLLATPPDRGWALVQAPTDFSCFTTHPPPFEKARLLVGSPGLELLRAWDSTPTLEAFWHQGGQIWAVDYAAYLLHTSTSYPLTWEGESGLRALAVLFMNQRTQAEKQHQILAMEHRMEVLPFLWEMEREGIFVDRAAAETEARVRRKVILEGEAEVRTRAVTFWNTPLPPGCRIRSWGDHGRDLFLEANPVWVELEESKVGDGGSPKREGIWIEDRIPFACGAFPDPVDRDEWFLSAPEERRVVELCAQRGCLLSQALLRVQKERQVYAQLFVGPGFPPLPPSLTGGGGGGGGSTPGKGGLLTFLKISGSTLHPKFNLTSSATSRLSTQQPNVQTIPRDPELRKLFTSRWGKEGRIVVGDYIQLEICILAALSQDPQLQADLKRGIDFHAQRVTLLHPGCSYAEVIHGIQKNKDGKWSQLRQQAKAVSFQRHYGGSAASIAQRVHLPVEQVETFFRKEAELYPGIAAYFSTVEQVAKLIREEESGSETFFFFPLPTGYRVVLPGNHVPNERKGGKGYRLDYTRLRNYPVQAFAAEVVQLMLGRLGRRFMTRKNYGGRAWLINTVHDSVWVDAHQTVVHEVERDMQEVLQNVGEVLQSQWPGFGLDQVSFRVAMNSGFSLAHSL